MKKLIVTVLTAVFLAGLNFSCAITSMITSRTNPYKPSTQDDYIFGSVQAEFYAIRGTDDWEANETKKQKDNKAYNALLVVAQIVYHGNIDIRDITWREVNFWKRDAVGYYIATGNVISGNKNINKIISAINSPLNKSVDKLIEDLRNELPRRTTIAMLSIFTDDPVISIYALEKIEQQFYDARHFTIIEKRFIDEVRREKRLQESDDIDPAKAAALAREEGWNVVVIGEISGSGSSRRLTLRAIDAEKGTILSRAMESF